MPGSAPAGAQVAVCGFGFLPGETVTVSFAGSTLGAAVADDLGAFRIVGTLPADVPPDSHPMEVQGDGGSLVELSYTIVG